MDSSPPYSRRADYGAKVLVVDDDAIVRRSLQAMLERGHYRVETVPDGLEALKILPVFMPDMVLLDILMPGMDGLETCRQIRMLPNCDLLPIIFLTADDRPETHVNAFQAKGDDFLRKPVSPAELTVRIRSLMRLKRLQAEIQAERDALLDSQRQKEQLFEFIVHDLKNPLTTIQVGLDLLGERAEMPAKMQAQVKRIRETAQGMASMVQNILDIGRAEQLGLELHRTRFRLRDWIPQVISQLEFRTLQMRQTMSWDCPEDLELVADQDLLRRVVLNLLDNALKYSPPGSRTRIEAEVVDRCTYVKVFDEGMGIPEHMREVVFDKFMRLEPEGPQTRASSGLGLTFCKVVSEAHGGRIWVDANPGKGSVFILEIPEPDGNHKPVFGLPVNPS
jgi:two-component system, sensor histidine kinase and response regulator